MIDYGTIVAYLVDDDGVLIDMGRAALMFELQGDFDDDGESTFLLVEHADGRPLGVSM